MGHPWVTPGSRLGDPSVTPGSPLGRIEQVVLFAIKVEKMGGGVLAEGRRQKVARSGDPVIGRSGDLKANDTDL